MTKDMTRGKPLSLILQFALPMVFGYMLQQLYSLCDTVIVGRCLGVNELAAVGSTGAVSFLVIGFATGMCTGVSIPISQAFGAGDEKNMRRYLANAFYLSAMTSIVMTVLTLLFTGDLLSLMKTPEELYDYAYDYIFTVFAGITATILYNLLSSMLRSIGDSRTPLIFLAIAAVLNIVLDFLFILGFHTGVAGAGYASVISQGISGILCLIYMFRKYEIFRIQKDEWRFSGQHCMRLLSISLPMALQFSITAVGSIILQTAVNTLGTVSVTAVTAASKLQQVLTGPMECLGMTMATYCGQNKGARKYDRIRSGIRTSVIVGMIYSVVSAIVIILFGGWMALLFLDASETAVMEQVKEYLCLNAYFYPMLALLFILRNALQGLSYSFLPMMAGVTELVARVLVCVAFVPLFGYSAACLASPVAWIFADVLLTTVYFVKMKSLRVQLAVPVAA
jgi:putative MATE family efflux protein